MIAISARAGAAGRRGQGARRARTRQAALNATGKLIVALLALFPIFWMISTAFKPRHRDLLADPAPAARSPDARQLQQVISGQAAGIGLVLDVPPQQPAVTRAVVLASALSLLAAVAVARFRFRLRTSFLIMLLIVQMVPGNALVIPLFLD